MGLFSRKKTEDKKKTDDKSAIVAKQSMKDLYGGAKTGVEKSKEGEKETKEKASGYISAYRVLMKPLVSEKASIMGAENKYFFAVERSANKIEIAKAIKQVYGIKPVNVNIVNMKGKNVRTGRTLGARKNWKKAIITLPKGESIKIYEGV
jgi:large subunit ribosomal protein L23